MRWLTQKKGMFKCQDGATAIEFAVLAPILFLIVFAIIEFSLILSASMVVESSTNISSRLGKTGYTEAGQSRQDMIYQLVRDKSHGLLNPDYITINTKSYSDLTNINQPKPYTDSNNNHVHDSNETYNDINGNGQWDADMGATGLGGADAIVVYTVSYNWQIKTPIFRELIGGTTGTFPISSTVVVKNEPYDQ